MNYDYENGKYRAMAGLLLNGWKEKDFFLKFEDQGSYYKMSECLTKLGYKLDVKAEIWEVLRINSYSQRGFSHERNLIIEQRLLRDIQEKGGTIEEGTNIKTYARSLGIDVRPESVAARIMNEINLIIPNFAAMDDMEFYQVINNRTKADIEEDINSLEGRYGQFLAVADLVFMKQFYRYRTPLYYHEAMVYAQYMKLSMFPGFIYQDYINKIISSGDELREMFHSRDDMKGYNGYKAGKAFLLGDTNKTEEERIAEILQEIEQTTPQIYTISVCNLWNMKNKNKDL